MNTRLARLAALVPLFSPTAGIGGEAVPPDLELASLAVTDGIVGGIIGPRPQVLLAAGFDRVERGFRAVRRKSGAEGDEVWVAELGPEQFRALLELALASGLPELPLESPPGCMDVYGRRRQIRLDYGKVRWANGAPGGCDQGRSTVIPSEDERRRFDEVVGRLEQAVDAFPLRRSSGVELQRVPFLADARALETYRRVMEHVLADPVRHGLDLERMAAWNSRASFCWRGRATGEPDGDVDFVIDRSGTVIRAPSPDDHFDRFAPVETGMTFAEVVARLGQPDEREECGNGSLVVTYLTSRPRWPGEQVLLPARLRFEEGRVSAP